MEKISMCKYSGSKPSPSTSVNKLRFVRERGFLHKLNRIRGPQCQFMHINKGPDLVWQKLKWKLGLALVDTCSIFFN